MARASRSRLQMLTANRLGGGEVVYAGPGGWTEAFAEAEIFDSPEAAEARLRAAAEDVRACRIVEPYLFDVAAEGAGYRPVSVREAIRAGGPSIVYGDRGDRDCRNELRGHDT